MPLVRPVTSGLTGNVLISCSSSSLLKVARGGNNIRWKDFNKIDYGAGNLTMTMNIRIPSTITSARLHFCAIELQLTGEENQYLAFVTIICLCNCQIVELCKHKLE